MIDMHAVLGRLCPSAMYRLDESHSKIIEWRSKAIQRPTQAEIDVCWAEIQQEVPKREILLEEIVSRLEALEKEVRT